MNVSIPLRFPRKIYTGSMIQQSDFLRGVNLGGWLILEKWMTESLFNGTDAIDEYTFMKTPNAAQKITAHRQAFIQERDFKWLADNGINAVRIPIGYWVFEDLQPYTATITYLDWAIDMAEKYKLRVLIDLHGAVGSQNGRDHSGRIGRADWFKSIEYQHQTVEVLMRLAQRYYGRDSVWGIELLNEPKVGLFHFKLRHFYKKAYKALVKVARPGLYIVFHDAFTPRLMSGVIKAKSSHPVAMDIHWYQFGRVLHMIEKIPHYFAALLRRPILIARLQRRQPVIVGEWSVVLSGKILDGASPDEEQILFKQHARLQLSAYEHTLGWFYWTYKTEGRGIWHFRSQVEDGVIELRDS